MVQKKPEYYSPTTVRSLLPDNAVPTENLFFDQSTNDPLQIISSKDLACKISFKITKNEIKKISTNIKGNENSFQPIPVIDKWTCPNVTSNAEIMLMIILLFSLIFLYFDLSSK
ncbi:unnamed protein product [Lasius platythorax]